MLLSGYTLPHGTPIRAMSNGLLLMSRGEIDGTITIGQICTCDNGSQCGPPDREAVERATVVPGATATEAPPLPVRSPSHGPDDFLIAGIGASARGLDACTRLVGALPSSNGVTFIFVQHLDPTHKSTVAKLLACHTSMAVRQATEGMLIEGNHLYLIPSGIYLSLRNGTFHLSQSHARHSRHLLFDFLPHPQAEECGARAICMILSGTGIDGSRGLKAAKEQHGLVIAQDHDEAFHDDTPRRAVMTGAVDVVLPVAKVPEALVTYDRRMALTLYRNGEGP
jgi:two-component system CheB/CheR fusion protein